MIDPLVSLVLSISLALLFLNAGRHKLSLPERFKAQLSAYQILPLSWVSFVARFLPWLEVVLAVALLIPGTRVYGGLVAGTLLVIYAAAVTVNLLRGRAYIDCGCGDRPQQLTYWLSIRNLACAMAAGSLLIPIDNRALVPIDLLFVALLSLALILVYLVFEQILQNLRFEPRRG